MIASQLTSMRLPRCLPRTLCVRASNEPTANRRFSLQSRDPSRDGLLREAVLLSVNVGVLASIFTFGAAPRPQTLGVRDYGGGVKSLNLCPATPNCIATSEAANDESHYAPPLLYNPPDGRGKDNPVTQKDAMAELVSVVRELEPDNFTPTIIENTEDYLYAEYQSPTFGFIDDVEFWFPSDKPGTVEYRSASRIGESDGQINRKRIRDIRKALEKFGWASAGF